MHFLGLLDEHFMGRRNKHHYNNHNQPRQQQVYQNGNRTIEERVTTSEQKDDAGASYEESPLLVIKDEGSTANHVEKDPIIEKVNHESSPLVDTPKIIPLEPKATFFNLIRAQLSLTDAPAAFATNTGQKHERIYNFLHVPQRLEKV